jgi:hypothetical protein
MTHQARLHGRTVQVLRPSKGGTGPPRWQKLIRIPMWAIKRVLTPQVGMAQMGVEYLWKAAGATYRVRMHDPDPSVRATPGNPHPNAFMGWVVRVSRSNHYFDPDGRLHHRSKFKQGSPRFDEFVVNETHIPLIPPRHFP